jgi:hypothetical protein
MIEDVSLIIIPGKDEFVMQTLLALKYSLKQLQFRNVVAIIPKDILFDISSYKKYITKTIEINNLNNILDYNTFMIKEYYKYIDTEFALNIQYDGFIINGHLWTDEFLTVDYIGAPWIITNGEAIPVLAENRVGNGGVSLRSKKFLMESSKLDYDGKHACDTFLCRQQRKTMEKNGIVYADYDLAKRFSIEWPTEKEHLGCFDDWTILKSLAFHGKFHTSARALLWEK